ncbi:MAG: BatA domain-containing protein [bacterium]
MTFIQPTLLWALPAVAIPVVIHLLNRLRFRSVKWAAMMFLLSATRSASRRARLRHYLILACRTGIVLAIVLAASRPLAGGAFAAFCGGTPDAVIVLLDRSASMETTDPQTRSSRRERALRLFTEAAGRLRKAGRFVLIENVMRTPQEVGAGQMLEGLLLTGPTDTAADLPAMFRAAASYIVENRPGRTEIWVASDLQKNNWHPDSAEWRTINAQLAALPEDVTVTVLSVNGGGVRNASVVFRSAERRSVAGKNRLSLGLDINRTEAAPASFPLVLTVDGARSQFDIVATTASLRYNTPVDLSGKATGSGWGKVDLPADDNARDNKSYFVYGNNVQLRAVIASKTQPVAKYLHSAATPGGSKHVVVMDPERPDSSIMKDASMLIWQAPVAGEQAERMIRSFAEEGGVVVFFPPGPGADAAGSGLTNMFDIRWSDVDVTVSGKPFRVATWDEYDGPLAKTDDGANLQVAGLLFTRRQIPVVLAGDNKSDPVSMSGGWITLAEFADRRPFLLRRRVGAGYVFACSSLPDEAWSNLGEGKVLVPMLQRMLTLGGKRMTLCGNEICGEWRPRADEQWDAVEASGTGDSRWHAGVYRYGTHLLALNRPPDEDNPDTVDSSAVPALMSDVKVRVVDDITEAGTGRSEGELWRLLVFLALGFMTIEAFLVLSEKIRKKTLDALTT